MTTTILTTRKRPVALGPLVPWRRRLRCRGRRTLVAAVLAFVLLQLALHFTIETVRPELRDPPFEIKARRLSQLIAQSPAPPVTVLMMGSSITGNGFNALDIESRLNKELPRPALVFNMSSQGSGPLTDLVWMRRLLRRGIKPDLLLIEVAPYFYVGEKVPGDIRRFPHYILDADDLDVIGRYGKDLDLTRKWQECRLVPAYGHRLTILNCLSESMVPMEDRINQWGGYDARFWQNGEKKDPAEQRARFAAVIAQFEPELRQFSAGQPALRALEELLELVQKHDVPTTLVVIPKAHALRRLYHAENLRHFMDTVDRLASRYHVDMVHGWDWLADDMFHDGYHPNDDGAEVFSRRIADEVVLPRLRRRLSP